MIFLPGIINWSALHAQRFSTNLYVLSTIFYRGIFSALFLSFTTKIENNKCDIPCMCLQA
jgi:hypothetical protein